MKSICVYGHMFNVTTWARPVRPLPPGFTAFTMDKKAVSEFRWTTVDETVKKGGVLTLMDEAACRRHCRWFKGAAPVAVLTHIRNSMV